MAKAAAPLPIFMKINLFLINLHVHSPQIYNIATPESEL
jgi:hypothetical protein